MQSSATRPLMTAARMSVVKGMYTLCGVPYGGDRAQHARAMGAPTARGSR